MTPAIIELRNYLAKSPSVVFPEDVLAYIPAIEAENAKLRSLCAEVAGILFNLEVDYCGLCDRDSINHPCPVHTTRGGDCLIESELRELVVEL